MLASGPVGIAAVTLLHSVGVSVSVDWDASVIGDGYRARASWRLRSCSFSPKWLTISSNSSTSKRSADWMFCRDLMPRGPGMRIWERAWCRRAWVIMTKRRSTIRYHARIIEMLSSASVRFLCGSACSLTERAGRDNRVFSVEPAECSVRSSSYSTCLLSCAPANRRI